MRTRSHAIRIQQHKNRIYHQPSKMEKKMAKGKNVGAAQNSHRKEEETSEDRKSDIRQENNNSKRKKIVCFSPNSKEKSTDKPDFSNPEEQKLYEACSIVDAFVRKCAEHPFCRAKALINLIAEHTTNERISEFKMYLSTDTVIHDAASIRDIMSKLEKDYWEEHDHADTALTEILSHYTPLLMYRLDFMDRKRKYLEEKRVD